MVAAVKYEGKNDILDGDTVIHGVFEQTIGKGALFGVGNTSMLHNYISFPVIKKLSL